MSDRSKPHHPLPDDDRARHDLIPESIEDSRDKGDDDPGQAAPSETEPPVHHYRNPDGTPYDS
ncbi:MAG: hypothetical protein JWN66_3920 [Sphingomonas bacterium]|jgi:hypothetical protein|uniref:hypothetical protein n=1 Tax=Sphingomonas bacterium TaxID=1895847 RepID=UPI0026085877|nr:hypothetical protein [Sphingomonas bacterium]MDB5706804.1 hypothetical protein [Sphingomonas bacterium]